MALSVYNVLSSLIIYFVTIKFYPKLKKRYYVGYGSDIELPSFPTIYVSMEGIVQVVCSKLVVQIVTVVFVFIFF